MVKLWGYGLKIIDWVGDGMDWGSSSDLKNLMDDCLVGKYSFAIFASEANKVMCR
jgi:hypothetical protein